MKKAGNLFVTAYLLLMIAVYPFIMKDGYADLGEVKYRFFIYCSMGALAVLGLIAAAMALRRLKRFAKKKETYLVDWDRISLTDLFVILYATAVYFSYWLSDDRQEALRGTDGWRMGLLTLLVLCALYFLISRMWEPGAWIGAAAVGASGIVFLLGIADSFSLYILPIENRQPGFISTLGNINWFCGYLSVFAPVGIGVFLTAKKRPVRWAAGIYTIAAFMAGFSQGSSSVFLIFGAALVFFLWIAVKRKDCLANWFLILSLWGFSALAVGFLRAAPVGYYNYETDNLCGVFTGSLLPLPVGAAGLAAYLLIRRGKLKETLPAAFEDRVHKALLFLLAAGALGWLAAGAVNTAAGIPALAGNEFFTFDRNWGNGRGASYAVGIRMFGEMSWIHKLFGVGPDCFASYAYSLPELAADLREWFGADRLTNAHNELLTGLVNTGVVGVSLYIGILLSFFLRCMKKGAQKPFLYIAAACVYCYFFHNMVSFAQVLNFPYLFLIMGMGEKLLRS